MSEGYMHELPVTQSILEIVLRHAEAQGVNEVLSVDLKIGALSDLEAEWLQSYFDALSRGTVAEGAKLRIHRSPLTFLCEPCAREFTATREELESARCPTCSSRDASVVAGTGYTVESMEAQ
jgi:hydrogenase nickel incorporation protein HypA/HybF